MIRPLIGNAVITLRYLASANAAAPVAPHIAAVVHAYVTSIPLPPHH